MAEATQLTFWLRIKLRAHIDDKLRSEGLPTTDTTPLLDMLIPKIKILAQKGIIDLEIYFSVIRQAFPKHQKYVDELRESNNYHTFRQELTRRIESISKSINSTALLFQGLRVFIIFCWFAIKWNDLEWRSILGPAFLGELYSLIGSRVSGLRAKIVIAGIMMTISLLVGHFGWDQEFSSVIIFFVVCFFEVGVYFRTLYILYEKLDRDFD